MIVGTGIDIVDICRVEEILKRRGIAFVKKVLHEEELIAAADIFMTDIHSKRSAAYLAARFAAKEAFAKALGTGFIKGLSLMDIQVHKDELDKPYLKFTGKAEEMANKICANRSHLCISHERKMAVAQVILESL